MIGSAKGSIGRPQQRTHQVARYPAPLEGIDISRSLSAGDLNRCVYTYNLCPFEYGMRVRQGYREWQIEVDSGSSVGIHTLIPFDSAEEATTKNRLFAVNNEGIWNVTDYDTTPVKMVTFSDTSDDAGYGTFTHYVDQAENDVLFYADNLNGLYSYDSATDTWTNTGILNNLNEADVKFVTTHKNNVWFAVTDSTVGYYLPLLSSTGDVSPQYFGDKFQHGGTLAGMFSWSVDGGDGVDDILVAVSTAGDVVVYTGSGPTQDTWGMRGIYYIGEIPNTPRFGTEQGGELYLLSAYGVSSMNDILKGVDTNILRANVESVTMAYRVAGLIREEMKDKIQERGWDIALVPSEGGLLISVPTVNSLAPIQFYFNTATRGWGIWRDVPMQCFTEYNDSVFFGTADNKIMRMDVTVDNELITASDPNYNGDDIEFSILSAYTPLGVDGVYKRVKLIRPDFLSTAPVISSSQARYDFDASESRTLDASASIQDLTGIWDTSNWDSALWGSRTGTSYAPIGGAWGYGRYVAVATKGSTRSTTRLLGWDVIYDTGGPMV